MSQEWFTWLSDYAILLKYTDYQILKRIKIFKYKSLNKAYGTQVKEALFLYICRYAGQ
jgi:hypothetical protein